MCAVFYIRDNIFLFRGKIALIRFFGIIFVSKSNYI